MAASHTPGFLLSLWKTLPKDYIVEGAAEQGKPPSLYKSFSLLFFFRQALPDSSVPAQMHFIPGSGYVALGQ